MLVELLRPAGPELARRWLAALLAVPRTDREAVVAEVERRIAATYGPGATAAANDELTLVGPPVQRDGYVEQVFVTYGRAKPSAAKPRQRAKRARRR